MSKIYWYERMNCLVTKEKKWKLKNQKIRKHSMIIHKQMMMFMKIWKTIMKQRKGEC